MKIRTRLTLYFAVLVMALIIIRSIITYYYIYQFNEKEFYSRLHAKALTTTLLLLNVNRVDSALLKDIDRYQYDLLDQENVSVYDSTNREIFTNNDTLYFKTSSELFQRIREEGPIKYTEGRYKIIAFYYIDAKNKVVVTAGAIDKGGEDLLKNVRDILIYTLALSVLLLSVVGWFFVGKSLEPISSIIQKVSHISPVERSERLPEVSEKDEMAALVRTFNKLFDKLEDSFKLQKNFVANVSHELNNPLAKIKSQLEVSLIRNLDNESYRQTIHSILEDVNELITLIHDLMKFSRLSSGQLITHTPLRADELIFEVRDIILDQFPDYKININFPDPPSDDKKLIFKGNKQLMVTAVKNIVENACKFSPDNTALINLEIKDSLILIAIHDNGPGIPKEDIPHVFDIFYRSASIKADKGYGIGLALAQRILQAHGFTAKVESSLGVGTIFTINIFN